MTTPITSLSSLDSSIDDSLDIMDPVHDLDTITASHVSELYEAIEQVQACIDRCKADRVLDPENRIGFLARVMGCKKMRGWLSAIKSEVEKGIRADAVESVVTKANQWHREAMEIYAAFSAENQEEYRSTHTIAVDRNTRLFDLCIQTCYQQYPSLFDEILLPLIHSFKEEYATDKPASQEDLDAFQEIVQAELGVNPSYIGYVVTDLLTMTESQCQKALEEVGSFTGSCSATARYLDELERTGASEAEIVIEGVDFSYFLDLKRLVDLIKDHCASLTLDNCNLGLSGSFPLKDLVNDALKLEELHLPHNAMNDDFCLRLCTAIVEGKVIEDLRVIDFSHNRLKKDGLLTAIVMAQRSSALEVLDLRHNAEDLSGTLGIAFEQVAQERIDKHPTLKEIRL